MASFQPKFQQHVAAEPKGISEAKGVRNLEAKFLNEDSNSFRVFNYNHPNQSSDDEVFRNGFQFKRVLGDKSCVPEKYDHYPDMFHQFYSNLIKNNIFNGYVEEVRKFFASNNGSRGCYMQTKTGRFPNARFYDNSMNEKDYAPTKILVTPKGYEAQDAIEEGEILFKEKAMIVCKSPACVCSHSLTFQCDYCLRGASVFYVCHNCSVAIYCTEHCRARALLEYHEFECRANKCHFFARDDCLWVAFRMLMIGTLYKFDRKTSNKYQYICQTLGNVFKNANVYDALRGTTLILVYLRHHTTYFKSENVSECYPNFTLKERVKAVGEILITHVLQAQAKIMYFPKELISFTSYSKGGTFCTPALCVALTKCVHSCKPNTAMVCMDSFYYLKAIRRIEAGESITINYVSVDEKFYGGIGDCLCDECFGAEYVGRLYICFACKGRQMERRNEHEVSVWVCRDCFVCETNNVMEEKVVAFKTIMQQIKDMDAESYAKSGYLCTVMFTLYDTFYSEYYPEWLYVAQKTFQLAADNLDLKQVRHCSDLLFANLPKCLHKYSFQTLDTLVSMVNYLLKVRFRNKACLLPPFVKIIQRAMELIQPLCKFYMLESQYLDLKQVVSNFTTKDWSGDIGDMEEAAVARKSADPPRENKKKSQKKATKK